MGVSPPLNSTISVRYGINANDLSYWTNDNLFYFNNITSGRVFKYKNIDAPGDLTFYTLYYNHASYGPQFMSCESFNGDPEDPRLYGMHGAFAMVDADGTGVEPSVRSGGHTRVWKGAMLSNCIRPRYMLVPVSTDVFVGAGSVPVTKTVKIYYQTNYTTDVGYDAILYFNDGMVTATGVLTARSNQADWSNYIELSKSITVEGFVGFKIRIWGYESAKYVWFDPIMSIT